MYSSSHGLFADGCQMMSSREFPPTGADRAVFNAQVTSVDDTFQRAVSVVTRLQTITHGIPFWIAGGSLTSILADQPVNDWDVFSSSPLAIKSLLDQTADNQFENNHVANYAVDPIAETVQLILRPFDSPIDTIKAFDFVANCIAVGPTYVVEHPDARKDIKNKTIRPSVIKYPLNTLKRITKYASRQWTIHNDTLRYVARGIADSNFARDLDNEIMLEQFYIGANI